MILITGDLFCSFFLPLVRKYDPFLDAAVSILMWTAFVLALFAVTGFASLSQKLVKLELGYTFLAALVIGYTIGELNGMLVRRRAAH